MNISTVNLQPEFPKCIWKSGRAVCMHREQAPNLKALSYDFQMKMPTMAVQHCNAITISTKKKKKLQTANDTPPAMISTKKINTPSV